MKINFIHKLNIQVLVAIIITILGDYLLYDEYIGVNLALFQFLLLTIALRRVVIKKFTVAHFFYLFLSFLLILSNLYEPNLLATMLFALQILYLFMSLQYPQIKNMVFFRDYTFSFAKRLPFKFFKDMGASQLRLNKINGGQLTSWLIPMGISFVFLILFSIANPFIEKYFFAVPIELLEKVQLSRVFVWSFFFCLAWGVLRLRSQVKNGLSMNNTILPNFNDRIILRCLFMFNVVFAIENFTDLVFLFSGKNLPDGISFAEYAHRGAYPLIITTIIAGIFVLIVFNENREKSKAASIYNLLYLWIAQNIFLLISSALRLIRYIDAYSLTELRLASLIWLALVAVGFLLMTIRIAKSYSNVWLIDQTSKALYATLYLCCFVNFQSEIALFNLTHSNVMDLNEKELDHSILYSYNYNLIPAYKMACKGAASNIKKAYFCELLNNELNKNKTALEKRDWKGSSIIRILYSAIGNVPNPTLADFKISYDLKNYRGFNYCKDVGERLSNEFYGQGSFDEQMAFAKSNQNNLYLYNLIYSRNISYCTNYTYDNGHLTEEKSPDCFLTEWLSHILEKVAPKHPIYEIMNKNDSDREYALGLIFHLKELKDQACFEMLCSSTTCQKLLYDDFYY